MAKSNDIAISTLQVQVDDVKSVMTQNIEKVLEREERLSELADRSDDLETAVIVYSRRIDEPNEPFALESRQNLEKP